ncbi:MAG: UvrD-helicase domain-containing protein, partial [Solirubrobacterales bacterium]
MPLHLISGLPNTGRTERLREEFEEAARAGRNPILLVPSVDDVFAWERRLTQAGESGNDGPVERASKLEAPAGGFAGGVVMHFNDLCREIVRRADGAGPRIAGEMRRRLALERAVAQLADVADGPAARIEGKTTNQPGLLDAALELVDEYRAERIEMGDPFRATGESIEGEGVEDGTIEEIRRGIEPLVTAFELDLADEGLTDLPKTAERALETVVGLFREEADWRARPVFVAGFDDMTGQQLELLRKLSNEAGVEVRMAVTWATDPGRGFLTDRLRSRLTDRVGIDSEDPFKAETDGDSPALALAGLADALIGAGERSPLEGNPPVTLIRAAGERREAEAIAAEIARLLADRDREVLPDQIAVAHLDPGSSGRLLEGILRRYGIPATLETETGALETTVGASLAALLRAAGPDGTAEDLMLWLRGPLGPERAEVDRIEAEWRRDGVGSAAEALGKVKEDDRGRWASLFDEGGDRGSAALELTATLAREAGRRILENSTQGPGDLRRPTPELELEVRMAETLAEAATDLAVSDTGGRSGAALMLEAIRRGDVSVWTVPTQGTVRITGLWAMRAKRVRFLFVAGLQEGGTRDLTRAGPFLSTAERRGLEMLERVDPEVQARYLLFSCLNVPTEELWLSCTISDDGGKSTAPSPLLAEIEALCPDPLQLIERNGSTVSFPVDRAPTAAELARALAVVSGSVEDLDLDAGVADEVRSSLERAGDLAKRSRTFGRFENPEVLAELAGTESFSPSEIEAWLACPWTWFIDRRIRPGRFTPNEEYLAAGNLVHEVLQTLYERHQGERPEPETVADWIAELPALFDSLLAGGEGNPLAGDDPSARLARLSLERSVAGLLESEADKASPSFVPALLEAPLEEVEMGDWKLRGKVDRVDTEDGRKPDDGVRALVIDYKSGQVGSRYSPEGMEEKGSVQIPLYMEALRRSLGIEPVAGFVLPVKDGVDRRPRGAIPAGEIEVIGERGTYRKGTVADIDEVIARALDLSNEAIEGIRGGEIEHSEGGCRNHYDNSRPLLPPLRPVAKPNFHPEQIPEEEDRERDSGDAGESGDFDFSEQQERVIGSDADEIMVSAAAGSGKTTVTVERYKRLLDDQGLNPDQILVFTFTDQAAAKLREEVRRARSAATGDPVTMSDAWVGTFHSICSRILTAYPLEAGVDPGFSVIDDINSSIMRRKAFDRALRRRLEATEEEGTEEAERRMAALAQVSRHTLRDTIDSIFDLLRSRGDEFPRLEIPFGRPDYPEAEVVALGKTLNKALSLEGVKRFSDDQKENCRKMLALIEDRETRTLTAASFDELSFSNKDLQEKTGLIGSWQTIETKLAEREAWPWLIEFSALLEEFGREYARLKDERSALDFEDLQIKALGLLEGNEAISAEYGSRFVEIMVDEFQDTNRLQMKLIEALRGGAGKGENGARLLTVGDEMQAIYGFRHADVKIFRERRRELAGGGDRVDLIDLPENHRSTPAVIEAINTLGREIHTRPGEGDEAGLPPFTELQAGRDDAGNGPATTLLLTPKNGWEESDLGILAPSESDLSKDKKATVAEALALAATIRELIDEGKYSQGDVAVLLRYTTDLATFEAALNQFGLRTVVPASKGFWKSRPVGELIALLATVANPHDDEAVISVLTSPACGAGPDGLWKVRKAAGQGEPLWTGVAKIAGENDGGGTDGELAAIASLYRVVEEARTEATTLSLESLVASLLDRSGLDLANLFRDRS